MGLFSNGYTKVADDDSEIELTTIELNHIAPKIDNECPVCYDTKHSLKNAFDCKHKFCSSCCDKVKTVCPICRANRRKKTCCDILKEWELKPIFVRRPENSEHPIMDRVDQAVANVAIATIGIPLAIAGTGFLIGLGCAGVAASTLIIVVHSPFTIRDSIRKKRLVMHPTEWFGRPSN